jgi:hypothetical protein
MVQQSSGGITATVPEVVCTTSFGSILGLPANLLGIKPTGMFNLNQSLVNLAVWGLLIYVLWPKGK